MSASPGRPAEVPVTRRTPAAAATAIRKAPTVPGGGAAPRHGHGSRAEHRDPVGEPAQGPHEMRCDDEDRGDRGSRAHVREPRRIGHAEHRLVDVGADEPIAMRAAISPTAAAARKPASACTTIANRRRISETAISANAQSHSASDRKPHTGSSEVGTAARKRCNDSSKGPGRVEGDREGDAERRRDEQEDVRRTPRAGLAPGRGEEFHPAPQELRRADTAVVLGAARGGRAVVHAQNRQKNGNQRSTATSRTAPQATAARASSSRRTGSRPAPSPSGSPASPPG